ncbi:MAG TPA: DUF5682 family protein [Actinospica sp.]|nr:DUF5682 family protein [Actinospica sp.]
MTVTYIGVRHHSPACARLVSRTIERLRPRYVLIEGPADMNARLGELHLRHQLPIAIFSSGPDVASFAPFCEYSPEWAALTAGRAAKAESLFIDLPAWHSAFHDHSNRYADVELHYAAALERLLETMRASSSDELWDRLFEVEDESGLEERLTAYFDLLRGEAEASERDAVREAYMARWIRAAEARAETKPVVVVTGGFHTPALRRLAAREADGEGWPEIPEPDDGAEVSSFLVPYSFRRLDAFTGYQSGMPSPEYYQLLWEHGPESAGEALIRSVAQRLRDRGQPASTADLIAARTQAEGLARLRGNRVPTRVDLLDGLVSALVSEDLDQPVPWSSRGTLRPGAHPAVVEMVAAISGDRVGKLHARTPAPPLVHDVIAELERIGLADFKGPLELDLTEIAGVDRSRVLHRLRVLGIPGFDRESGPESGLDPEFRELWKLKTTARRSAALIEAGAYGATLAEAAVALLERRTSEGAGIAALATTLFDTVLCGLSDAADQLIARIAAVLTTAAFGSAELGPLGAVLAAALGLWRHDRLFEVSRSSSLAQVIGAAAERVLALAQSVTGPDAAADPARLSALVALRDAIHHAEPLLPVTRDETLSAAERIAKDLQSPPDLRGAALGLAWTLTSAPDTARALPVGVTLRHLGDWLAGLFVLAREEAATPELIAVLDDLVTTRMDEEEFLGALPALRMAFGYFPPREKESVARRLLERRGRAGDARGLIRLAVSPEVHIQARGLELAAFAELLGTGLLSPEAEAIVQEVRA